MARNAKLEPIQTTKGWCLSIPKKLTTTGKRARRYFPTKRAALAARKELMDRAEEFGTQAAAIPVALAEQATAAADLLSPYGITILQAAERIAELEQRARSSCTVSKAVEAFIETKEGRSLARRREIKYLGEMMIEAFGDCSPKSAGRKSPKHPPQNVRRQRDTIDA